MRLMQRTYETRLPAAPERDALLDAYAALYGRAERTLFARLTREFLEDPRHHIAVAIEDGVVVGFTSGVHYIHPDKPPELWINEVGLAPRHRRGGLGKGVLRALFEVGRAHHRTIAGVLTDRSNVRRYGTLFIGRWDRRSRRRGAGNAMLEYSFALTNARKCGPSDSVPTIIGTLSDLYTIGLPCGGAGGVIARIRTKSGEVPQRVAHAEVIRETV